MYNTMLQPPFQRSTAWLLAPYSYQILVSSEKLIPIRRIRGSLSSSTRGLGDILHDLLASSFGRNVEMLLGTKLIILSSVPLTDHRMDPDEIDHQATEFLSSFSDSTGTILSS